MATVNFYLKDPKATAKTPIYLFFNYQGDRMKFGTGASINPKFWNFEKQEARKSLQESFELNGYLDRLKNIVMKIYNVGNMEGMQLSPFYIREKLLSQLNRNTENKVSFFECYDKYIEVSSVLNKDNTIKKHETLLEHLKVYEKKKHTKLTFDNINDNFYDSFMSYCVDDLGHINTTFGKSIMNLKTFLHWATKKGYNANTSFKDFKVYKGDVDIIYLTEDELMGLYKLDLKNNKSLSDVRDVFCFGCFTSLRYSDLKRLRKENIKGDEIQFVSQKTQDRLNIPLNDYAKEILEKHNYSLPVISNQKANEHLKKLGKIAKIDDVITITKFRGKEEVIEKAPKYKFLSCHTARRTFVTLSLEKGMRVEMVMAITAHKDYKTFKKYIKIVSRVKILEMKKVWFKEPQLKVG